MQDIKQFDTSEIVISDKNFAEAGVYDIPIYFNESYIVSGDIEAPQIYGSYNLVVLGDLISDQIEVKGKLTVMGKIVTKSLIVEESLICVENIDSERILVGGNIQAEAIHCSELSCTGNIIVQTIVEVEEEIKVKNLLVAAEGILGRGNMKISNVITGEYFEFEGSVLGKVIDLGEDSYKCVTDIDLQDLSFNERIKQFRKKINEELQKAGDVDENKLREVIQEISEFDCFRWCDWANVIDKVIDLSYEENIENFRDYLIVIYANKIFPKIVTNYETLIHVFTNMMKEAEIKCADMVYTAQDMDEFALSIYIIERCENELPIDKRDALDKVFQSIGIKYRTVEKFLKQKK